MVGLLTGFATDPAISKNFGRFKNIPWSSK
jgi:hypothetical protein